MIGMRDKRVDDDVIRVHSKVLQAVYMYIYKT